MQIETTHLTHDEKLNLMYARDANANGLFITGVLTTGIYCLPSCPARKPKAENVRFFDSETKAQAAGLRPCKRCKPDYFYANLDPDRDDLYTALEKIKHDPATVSCVSELAKYVGFSESKLYHMIQLYRSTTPAELMHAYRIERAKYLFTQHQMSVTEAAFEVGYDSISTFYDRFKQQTGSTPGAYRRKALGEQVCKTNKENIQN